MNSKRKSFVALLAAFSVGTAVAAVAMAAESFTDHRFGVYAASSDDETQQPKLEFGTNTVTLAAGVSQTFALEATEAGIYGFELSSDYTGSGSVTVTVSDADGVILTGTLSASNLSLETELDSPESVTVTLLSETDLEIELHMTYNIVYTGLSLGSNTVSLVGGESERLLIEKLDAGYYTFTGNSGSAVFTVGKEEYTLTDSTSFTVYLTDPATTFIYVSSESDVALTFVLSYSETDPAKTSKELSLGTQTVEATGDGVEYTFTSANGGSYTLLCTDENAYIMLVTTYSDPDYGDITDWEWLENSWYTFTLEAGESVNFLMSTEDWSDDTYDVTVVKALVVGTQTVEATGAGVEYTFTSDNGGTYKLTCTDSNAYIMLVTTYSDPEYGDVTEWTWLENSTYTFTLKAGESVVFAMSTDDFNDDTYAVTIEEVVEEEN